MELASIILGGLNSALLALGIWILTDLRARITRLEDGHMNWNGNDRRKI